MKAIFSLLFIILFITYCAGNTPEWIPRGYRSRYNDKKLSDRDICFILDSSLTKGEDCHFILDDLIYHSVYYHSSGNEEESETFITNLIEKWHPSARLWNIESFFRLIKSQNLVYLLVEKFWILSDHLTLPQLCKLGEHLWLHDNKNFRIVSIVEILQIQDPGCNVNRDAIPSNYTSKQSLDLEADGHSFDGFDVQFSQYRPESTFSYEFNEHASLDTPRESHEHNFLLPDLGSSYFSGVYSRDSSPEYPPSNELSPPKSPISFPSYPPIEDVDVLGYFYTIIVSKEPFSQKWIEKDTLVTFGENILKEMVSIIEKSGFENFDVELIYLLFYNDIFELLTSETIDFVVSKIRSTRWRESISKFISGCNFNVNNCDRYSSLYWSVADCVQKHVPVEANDFLTYIKVELGINGALRPGLFRFMFQHAIFDDIESVSDGMLQEILATFPATKSVETDIVVLLLFENAPIIYNNYLVTFILTHVLSTHHLKLLVTKVAQEWPLFTPNINSYYNLLASKQGKEKADIILKSYQ
ncbi:hypothetical protein ROZALSC1DRAFT_29648 [Rozella allomycis CSF55]|uniref:Uncharacterized protein n=1 Tax=Rozella allomycis (strain CSF55) TaxID=988480 RepID=A0A075B200_ROZAC|nr:hypothetical protein O9G_002901 [Rozella allomycis CSF55]RKP18686.1 hypothetical protein ROZALSC1DRAFT_29648 [Rozella allomycis CSF55]|eukprot:EPZ36400.1 hypothetical protein O9G_002901 [Rozella allomycis CSF55]